MIHLERERSDRLSSVVASPRFFRRDRTHARSIAREVRIAPSRFVDSILEMSTVSVLGRILEIDIPAALTRTSTFSWIDLRN